MARAGLFLSVSPLASKPSRPGSLSGRGPPIVPVLLETPETTGAIFQTLAVPPEVYSGSSKGSQGRREFQGLWGRCSSRSDRQQLPRRVCSGRYKPLPAAYRRLVI